MTTQLRLEMKSRLNSQLMMDSTQPSQKILGLSMASTDTFKQIQCSITIALVPTYPSSIDVCYLHRRTSLTQSSPATNIIILTSSIIPTNCIRIILPYILNPSLPEVNSLDWLSKSWPNVVTITYSFVLSTKLNTTTK